MRSTTWRDPGGTPAPGGPGGSDDDATRADWNLAELDALVSKGPGGASRDAGTNEPAPLAPGPPGPPGPPAAPAYGGAPASGGALGYASGGGGAPGYAPGYVPGYPPGCAPGYPPANGAGMVWAPPPDPAAIGGGFQYGGTLERIVAYLVDGLVMVLIGIAMYVVAALVGLGPFANLGGSLRYDVYDPIRDGAGSVVALLVLSVISAAISAAYFILGWSGSHRATPGMRVLGLQIGNAADGRTLTRDQAFRRWIALAAWSRILSAIPGLSGLAVLGLLARSECGGPGVPAPPGRPRSPAAGSSA